MKRNCVPFVRQVHELHEHHECKAPDKIFVSFVRFVYKVQNQSKYAAANKYIERVGPQSSRVYEPAWR